MGGRGFETLTPSLSIPSGPSITCCAVVDLRFSVRSTFDVVPRVGAPFGAAVGLHYLAVFALVNLESVTVDFVVAQVSLPVFFVVTIPTLLGFGSARSSDAAEPAHRLAPSPELDLAGPSPCPETPDPRDDRVAWSLSPRVVGGPGPNPGMAVFGLLVVRGDGTKVGWGHAAIRTLALPLSLSGALDSWSSCSAAVTGRSTMSSLTRGSSSTGSTLVRRRASSAGIV